MSREAAIGAISAMIMGGSTLPDGVVVRLGPTIQVGFTVTDVQWP